MSDNVIKYDFAGLGTLSGDLNTHFQRLGQLADSLKSEVSKLDANWQSSQGAVAYQTAQSKFDRAFEEARTQLHSLGRGVQNASDHMANTDQQVSRGFQV